MRELTRRQFCVASGVGLAAVGCVGCGSKDNGSDGGAHDMAASQVSDFSGIYVNPDFACGNEMVGGPFAMFAVGTATFYRCARLFICRDDAGVYAMTSICTHQQCDVAVDKGMLSFTCPCHGSQFDANGNVTHDPAKLPLVHFKCSLDANGNVVVDPSTTVAASVRLAVPGD